MQGVPRMEGSPVSDVPSRTISISFSILGVAIRLKAHPAADVEAIVKEYAAFECGAVVSPWEIEWDGCSSPQVLTFDGQDHPIISPQMASPIISTKMMDHVYQATKDFYLFHGAAAAWRGVLLLFPGESGVGKSSLALSLGRRQWSIFSDELIPLSRRSLRVVPFPRAILVWGSSPELHMCFPDERRPAQSPSVVGEWTKTVIPSSCFEKASEELSPRAIVSLQGGRREVRCGGGEIAVTYWDEKMEKLAKEKGVYDGLQVRKTNEFWCVQSDHMEVIEDICTSLGGIVVEREVTECRPPAFSETAVLEQISPSECLDSLWSVFENGRALAEAERGAAALYLGVAEFVKNLPCYRLRLGEPTETCELLRNLAEGLAKGHGCGE